MKPFASLSKRSVDPDGPGFIGGLSGRPGSVRRSFLAPHFLLFALLSLSPLLLCSPAAVHAQWEPDKRLTYNDSSSVTSWSNARSVAACGDTVHVVWYDHRDGNDEIYYKRSTDNGATWDPDTALTQDPSFSGYPSVAVSGSGVIAVWIDSRDTTPSSQKVFYKRSADNGQTWGPDLRLSDDTSYAGHPSVTFSGSVVQAVWAESRDGGNPEIYTKRSNNGGGSWGADTRLTVNSYTSDDPSAAVSGSYVHVVWRDQRVGLHDEIYYKRSTTSGTTWGNDTLLSIGDTYGSSSPSISVSGSVVHVAWYEEGRDGNFEEVYYKRSTDNGATWGPVTRLTYNPDRSWYPSISSYGSAVQVVWYDGGGSYDIFSKRSTDNGTTWSPDTRLTTGSILNAHCQSLSITANTAHMVWFNIRDGNLEVYYKRRLGQSGYDGFLTEPSQGRHLVRDPSRGQLHMVMHSEDDSVYYCRSTDNGDSWSTPLILGYGKYPTVGLVQLPWMIWPPLMVVSVAYLSPGGSQLLYQWNDGTSDPGTGTWYAGTISPIGGKDAGAPSLVTGGDEYVGQGVFVAYASTVGDEKHLFCNRFFYSDPGHAVVETLDETSNNPGQPCLSVDGNGEIYAAWQRGSMIYYAPRGQSPYWSNKLRVDRTTDPSQQPFVECYGDSVFVAWADREVSLSYFDVWRVGKHLQADTSWWSVRTNISYSSTLASESPTQAWREFTTWSDSSSGAQSDIWYYSPNANWGKNRVQANSLTGSNWPHSQMSYTMAGGAYLWSAWTESPIRNQPPYTVLTNRSYFAPPPPPGDGDSFSGYYSVQAGQEMPSPYCLKRDGVMRFADKAVDFARDSLVYELPYLDPQYDYYLRVSSYREAGSNWAQALSVSGSLIRSVQLKSNQVDTAWIKIPPKAYQRDRKVIFAFKKVKGDYVTSLGLMLYQRDPLRGKGGPQSVGLADLPQREVFAVYPNPVNAQAQVEFSLRTPGKVSLMVYNVLGRLVRVLEDEVKPTGVYRVSWDGKDADGRLTGSGVYFMKLNTPERTKTARLVVVR